MAPAYFSSLLIRLAPTHVPTRAARPEISRLLPFKFLPFVSPPRRRNNRLGANKRMISGTIYEVSRPMAKEPPICQSTCRERDNNYYHAKEDNAEFVGLTSVVIIYTCHDSYKRLRGTEWPRGKGERKGTEINIEERNIRREKERKHGEMARCRRLHTFPI